MGRTSGRRACAARRTSAWLVLGLLAACTSGSEAPRDPRYAAAGELTVGCGGGIAGTYAGTTAYRDGRVVTWIESATAAGDEVRTERRVDVAEVARLFEGAERASLLELELGQPGNWGCSLTLAGPGWAHAVYYEEPAPPEIAALVEALQDLAPTPR